MEEFKGKSNQELKEELNNLNEMQEFLKDEIDDEDMKKEYDDNQEKIDYLTKVVSDEPISVPEPSSEPQMDETIFVAETEMGKPKDIKVPEIPKDLFFADGGMTKKYFVPRYVKDKISPNFLNVYIDYPTPSGVQVAYGKETMSGQQRKLGSEKAMNIAKDIVKDIKEKHRHNLEDIDYFDNERGKVTIFAVSDDFEDTNFALGGYLTSAGIGAYYGAKNPKSVKKVTDPIDKAISQIGKNLTDKKYAKGGKVNKVYVDYMNKKKGFRPDRKYFKTYEEAEKWGRKEFERFNSDMIGYTEFERPLNAYAEGGIAYVNDDFPELVDSQTYVIDGVYGSNERESEIYVKELSDGGKWYALRDSKNINFTNDSLYDGINVEEVQDLETISSSSPIEYADDLDERIVSHYGEEMEERGDDYYAKGGALSKEFKFDKNFVIYVPSTTDVGNKISKKELDKRVGEVEKYVANEFGGYTETDTDGGYKSTSGEIIEEDIVKVSVFANNKDWKENESKVVSKVKEWATKWGQEAIGFEYEGDLYYIDEEGKFAKGGMTEKDKLDEAIKHFEDKIKKQGRITNARDEEQLSRLKELRKSFAEGGEVESSSELYDTYFEKYPYATELVAYYIYDYKDDNDIYNMEIGKYGKPIDITPYSELMLDYENTWKDKMPELDEQVKELIDNESMETGMFAKGGETASPITNYHKNFMGTLSFDLKVKGMRKPQDFIVYPITGKTNIIRIQSDKKWGEIDATTGKGILSKTGNNSWAFALDVSNRNVNKFDLTPEELEELKSKIRETSGKEVGNVIITTDNSGAELLEEGGVLDMNEVEIYEGPDDNYTIVMKGDVYGMNTQTLPNLSINMYEGDRSEYPSDISHWGKKMKFDDAPIVIKEKIEMRKEEYKEGGRIMSEKDEDIEVMERLIADEKDEDIKIELQKELEKLKNK